MKTIEQLTEIADELISKNKGLVLSGSLALALQGVKLRRNPVDLDFFFTHNKALNKIDGIESVSSFNSDDYNDESWIRLRYRYKGVEFDVFTPNLEEGIFNDCNITYTTPVPCLYKSEIIKFKIEHALDRSISKNKHVLDCIHILVNN